MFVDLLPNSPTAERQSHLDSLARYTVALSDFVCPEPDNLDFEVADSGARGQAGHRSDEAFLQALRIQKLVRLRCLAPGYPRRLGRQRSTCRAGAVAHFVEDGTFSVSNEVPGSQFPCWLPGATSLVSTSCATSSASSGSATMRSAHVTSASRIRAHGGVVADDR
jgi:hypothetical protein